MKYLFYIIIALMFFHFLTKDSNPPPEKFKPFPEVRWDSTKGDAAYFDWEQNRYVYKHELKPEGKREKIPLTAKPDSYVQIVEPGYAIKDDYEIQKPDPEIIIAGKRYRQRKLANGDIKLILVR